MTDPDRTLAQLCALAQDTRLAVFRLLMRVDADGLSAGEIAGRLSVAPNTLSGHLTALRLAGLIAQRREGRRLMYAADVEGARALVHALIDDACAGRPDVTTGVADRRPPLREAC